MRGLFLASFLLITSLHHARAQLAMVDLEQFSDYDYDTVGTLPESALRWMPSDEKYRLFFVSPDSRRLAIKYANLSGGYGIWSDGVTIPGFLSDSRNLQFSPDSGSWFFVDRDHSSKPIRDRLYYKGELFGPWDLLAGFVWNTEGNSLAYLWVDAKAEKGFVRFGPDTFPSGAGARQVLYGADRRIFIWVDLQAKWWITVDGTVLGPFSQEPSAVLSSDGTHCLYGYPEKNAWYARTAPAHRGNGPAAAVRTWGPFQQRPVFGFLGEEPWVSGISTTKGDKQQKLYRGTSITSLPGEPSGKAGLVSGKLALETRTSEDASVILVGESQFGPYRQNGELTISADGEHWAVPVRRTFPGNYDLLIDGEAVPLPAGVPYGETLISGDGGVIVVVMSDDSHDVRINGTSFGTHKRLVDEPVMARNGESCTWSFMDKEGYVRIRVASWAGSDTSEHFLSDFGPFEGASFAYDADGNIVIHGIPRGSRNIERWVMAF